MPMENFYIKVYFNLITGINNLYDRENLSWNVWDLMNFQLPCYTCTMCFEVKNGPCSTIAQHLLWHSPSCHPSSHFRWVCWNNNASKCQKVQTLLAIFQQQTFLKLFKNSHRGPLFLNKSIIAYFFQVSAFLPFKPKNSIPKQSEYGTNKRTAKVQKESESNTFASALFFLSTSA